MTRYRFGGDAAAWVVDLVTDPAVYSGAKVIALSATDVAIPFYGSQSGLALVDFLDSTGSPITSISVPGGSPYLPFFFGPEDITSLWFQDVNNVWHILQSSDLSDRMAAAEHVLEGLQDGTIPVPGVGGGGGGAGVNFVYQETPGTSGYPANPNPSVPTFWIGPDQPPLGVVAGTTYMVPGDQWLEPTALVDITP